MATPFVEGRLRKDRVEIEVTSECRVSGREIRLWIDSDMHHEILTPRAAPYLFEPHIDWQTFRAPNIIQDY